MRQRHEEEFNATLTKRRTQNNERPDGSPAFLLQFEEIAGVLLLLNLQAPILNRHAISIVLVIFVIASLTRA